MNNTMTEDPDVRWHRPPSFTPEFRLMLAVNSAQLAGYYNWAKGLRALLPADRAQLARQQAAANAATP